MVTWISRAGRTGSTLSHLEGSLSGSRVDPDSLVGLDADGRPFLPRYDLTAAGRTLTKETISERRTGGLWRWHEILPVRDWQYVATLGEGRVPLVEAPRLGLAFGLSHLYLKNESLNPTGSFKARGMSVAVSRAVELGARLLVAPSAGNAAGALAAYAAVAGVPAIVVMPADAPRANQVEVVIAGATLILLEGLISDCGRFVRRLSERLGGFDLCTLKEPYRVEGKKTMGLELAEEFDWELPDAVIYPTGGGTGVVGMWKAFAELEQLGLIGSGRPRMYCVQADGCAPIVTAYRSGQRFASPVENATTRAAGIRVPSAVGDFLILDAITASHGAAVAVPECEIVQMQRFAAVHGAGYVSLETAAAICSLPHLIDEGMIDANDRIVLFDTGAGFKSEEPTSLDIPRSVPNDPTIWDDVIVQLKPKGTVPAAQLSDIDKEAGHE
jgi:threonine synthase